MAIEILNPFLAYGLILVGDITGGIVVYTCIHRWLTSKWWFQKFPKNKKWMFKIDNQGWSIEGKGTNPFKTLEHMYDSFVAKREQHNNKPLREEIRSTIKHAVRENVRQNIQKSLQTQLGENAQTSELKTYIDDVIKQAIKDELNGTRQRKHK